MLTPTRSSRRQSQFDIPHESSSVNSSSKYPLVPVAALNTREITPRLRYKSGCVAIVATVRMTPERYVVPLVRRFTSGTLTRDQARANVLEGRNCAGQEFKASSLNARGYGSDVETESGESVLITA
jgi:hypothetical protein